MEEDRCDAGEEAPFEIRDFSVATPWEAFVCEIEEALRAWLSGAAPPEPGGVEHRLVHEGRSYVVSLHGDPSVDVDSSALPAPVCSASEASRLPSFMAEMLEPRTDFASDAFSQLCAERLPRWFGLTTFVLLGPAEGESLEPHEMALMQGALNVAMSGCDCALPAFVPHPSPSA